MASTSLSMGRCNNTLNFFRNILDRNIIRLGITEAVTDKVNYCLKENMGLGCLYCTVIDDACNIEVHQAQILDDMYFIIIDYDNRRYHVVKDKIIIYQSNYMFDDNIAGRAMYDFVRFRYFTRAIELAALGQWTNFRKFVYEEWEYIMDDITIMDAQGSLPAHMIRLEMGA